MTSAMMFTPTERERLGVVVNNVSFYASQLINGTDAALTRRALANLATVKREDDALLKRLDELAREQGDESPLRLIEDLVRVPSDAAQMLALARRCMLVAAFLGHCIAQPNNAQVPTEQLQQGKRLH
jgi:gamma-glutamyl:cysteine ligase YbdK (ATP-grasp superfamily)